MLKLDFENVVNGRPGATNFTARLLRLIFKADGRHKEMLGQVFPNAVKMVDTYQDTGEILSLPYD